MKKIFMCVIVVVVLVGIGFVVQVEDGWYGCVDIGNVFEGCFDYDVEINLSSMFGSDLGIDDNMLYSIGFGYGFDSGFCIEMVLMYCDGDLDVLININGGILEGILMVLYDLNQEGDVWLWDLMVNVFYDFNCGGNLQLYIGVGIGVV